MSRNNSSLYSSLKSFLQENSIELINETSFQMKIDLGKGKSDNIIIDNNSKPEELAYILCLKNNLDYKYLLNITNKIKFIKEKYSFKYKYKSVENKNNKKSEKNLKKIFMNQKTVDINNNKYKIEKNLTEILNNELLINSSNEFKKNNITDTRSENKKIKHQIFQILKKKLTNKLKNKENINYNNISLSNKKDNNDDINNNHLDKNLVDTTNVISQTIQKCLKIVENEEKPFYNESNSEINKDSASSKYYGKSFKDNDSEIKLESFINNGNNNYNNAHNLLINNSISNNNINYNNISYYNEDKINLLNTNKEISKIFDNGANNNNFGEDEIFIEKESFLSNKINSNQDNSFNNEIQSIIQEKNINKAVSKTERNNISKEKINNNKSINDKENNNKSLQRKVNNNLIISEKINLNILSSVNRETSINKALSPKIPYHNRYKDNFDEKFKKCMNNNNRCITKVKNNIKVNSDNNKNNSSKNKNKGNLKLINDTHIQLYNSIEKNYKQSPSNYDYMKNKNGSNNHEIEFTPSTYIKSCKNSLSSMGQSEKNLILNLKKNNLKNNILNKYYNGNRLDDFSSNILSSFNNSNIIPNKNINNFTNIIQISQRCNNNSLCPNNIINEELENKNNNTCDTNSNSNEKNKKNCRYKKLLKNYLQQKYLQQKNNNIKNKADYSINDYYKNKTAEIGKNKQIKVNKNNMLFENNNIKFINRFSNFQSFHKKNKSNNFNSYLLNKKSRNNVIHKITRSDFFTYNAKDYNLFKSSIINTHSTKSKHKFKRIISNFNFTKENIIQKNEIEISLKKIFNHISINNCYLDAFSALNTKTIPSGIYKPVHCIIKNCDKKKRFISANEFIRKGSELFHFFSQEEKIAILNFKIFS